MIRDQETKLGQHEGTASTLFLLSWTLTPDNAYIGEAIGNKFNPTLRRRIERGRVVHAEEWPLER